MQNIPILTAIISKHYINQRISRAIIKIFPNFSYSRIKKLIFKKCVLVNEIIWDKPHKKVLGGELILINNTINHNTHLIPQKILLNVVYEDHDVVVINKPCNIIVHPGAGNPNLTICNALLYYYPKIINVPRLGIVHRLDKNTTGLMIIAKTIKAYNNLISYMKLHKIIREYEAIVIGRMISGGVIKQPIIRHPIKRTIMSVHETGKNAVTHYRIVERFRSHTLLRLRLETGRTHQIRVHMSYIRHPILGDKLYGGHNLPPKGASKEFITALNQFNYQALHARMICFYHPISGIKIKCNASIPQNMEKLINEMRIDFKSYET